MFPWNSATFKYLTMTYSYYHYRGNTPPRLSSNSEANSSEFLENLEEIFPGYCIHSTVIGRFKSSTTPYCVTRRKRVNRIIVFQFVLMFVYLACIMFTLHVSCMLVCI